MLDRILHVIKYVAATEIMPRYLKVARHHKSDGSLCTEADIAAQAALSGKLYEIAPYPVLGEEMSAEQQNALWQSGSGGLWCIDPIDGTSNFVNGLPYFAVSVALLREGKPELGVVYNPATDEAFYAKKGHRAFLNGKALPLRRSDCPDLGDAMACIDFKRLDQTMREKLAGTPPYRSQRNFGASALDWCYVAAGRIDIYLHGGQKLWDYAAGSLILEAAGGAMCSLDNDDFWHGEPWQRAVIAALNPTLFHAWKIWVQNVGR